jgi:hypothetical protein
MTVTTASSAAKTAVVGFSIDHTLLESKEKGNDSILWDSPGVRYVTVREIVG